MIKVKPDNIAPHRQWPQQFDKESIYVEGGPTWGWQIFPFGDCIAVILYVVHKSGQKLWKFRIGHRQNRPVYNYDLMTIKKENAYNVAQAIMKVAGVEGKTREDINQMQQERQDKIADDKLEEQINRLIGRKTW